MIHLSCRSHFSIGESLLTPTDMVKAYASKGATALALTDTMRISGLPEFVSACLKNSIKPIIGARLRIVATLAKDKTTVKKNRPYFLRLIVKTDAGYRALLKLLSLAFDADHFYEVPRLLLSDVCDIVGASGRGSCLVTLGDFYSALSAGIALEVVAALSAADIAHASEIMPIPTAHFERMAHEALALQESDGVTAILTMPAFYETAEQADSLDVMKAIGSHFPMSALSGRHAHRDFTPKSEAESWGNMLSFGDRMNVRYGRARHVALLEEAKTRLQEVVDSVTFMWKKEKPSLPKMAPDEFKEIMTRCQRGWKIRFAAPVYGHLPTDFEPYKKRLAYELGVLRKLEFEGYFLLVGDIVDWCKGRGIRVGPGRGSVGGSLVSYLMGITDIDPIRFGLIFERFITADRIDLPDIDMDFMASRRLETFDYAKERFGEEHVAGVSNHITMGAASALTDVCRTLSVYGHPTFGPLIPKIHEQSASIVEAMVDSAELIKFAKNNPGVVGHALNLEDRIKTYGQHAAGLVIADVPIKDRGVLERREGGQAVVNWDKDQVESFGLIKIDVLGLLNLDMLDVTLRQIFLTHGKKIDPKDIPLDDEKVLEAFGRGETIGVFQFESSGMRKLLTSLAKTKPLNFDDLTAATALFRPGPMDAGLMEQFVKVKQGLVSPSYPHPSMTDALSQTYGVIVYQEEVMQVARDFAGLSLTDSDHLRKAMGKKDKVKMAEWRDAFVQGAVATHGVNIKFAEEIFDQIEKFAGYGFNKSHASAYALSSYVGMWLKVYYPAEFFCGLLSYIPDNRRQTVMSDMVRLGIELLPPDINSSTDIFTPFNAKAIQAPLTAIKNVSSVAYAAIIKARQTPHSKTGNVGLFTSREDFEDRVAKGKCNIKVRDNLDRVGAFARIETDQLPANDHTRRRDHVELMSGLITEAVVIDREVVLDHFTVPRLNEIVNGWRQCTACELKGLCHPKPWVKAGARAFVVLDGPGFKEEGKDEMGWGGQADSIESALVQAGLKKTDVYITSIIKSPKPNGSKTWPNTTLTECPQWLDKEILELRPSVIVVLGPLAAAHFTKDLKGGLNENVGRVSYDATRDCNILLGINPASIYFDASKQAVLDTVFNRMVELLPSC